MEGGECQDEQQEKDLDKRGRCADHFVVEGGGGKI